VSEPAPHAVYTSLLAHEVRTPVTSIFGYLQLLSDDRLLDDPDLLRQYLAVVRGRAEALARIVSELTTFADLLTRDDLPARDSQPMGLQQLLSELGHGRRLRIEVSADASSAAVDLDRLQLVLRQLVDNAFKFGTPGAQVVVRATVQPKPGRLIVRVSNRGAPIPVDLRGTIFAAYRQAEPPDTRRNGGLGLGLTVARHAAEGAGGSLVLEPGELTTFRLELPLREDPIARQAAALREQAALMDAQALRAVQDMRAARAVAQRERQSRELAEAQQLRAVEDFRVAHREAVVLANKLDKAYMETISALARSVEARDSYTGTHVERVRLHSLRIGEARGMSAIALRQLEFGAVLHDVGKIGIPDAILQKPGPLDPAEWTFMRHHPEIGRRVLEGIGFLADALDAVGCHHERWDGGGYPGGLAGEAIPLFGRIVAVADAYDAMITDRPYRTGLRLDVALQEIEHQRGTQFDPDIATAFLANPPER
jgi:HD-GYP domain-containing protein (c-di-GMP phosphodiesterase class II)/anti-sigma regulatory factor (Ser/Thr protein kinase)